MLSFPVFACTEPRSVYAEPRSVPDEGRSVVAHSQPMQFPSTRDLYGRRQPQPCLGVGCYPDANRRALACSPAIISVHSDLSPLKCVLAAKHRVLPVFSRNAQHLSPLETTLASTRICVDSKWLTETLSPLYATLTENIGVGTRVTLLLPLRASVRLWQSQFRQSVFRPIAANRLWCHNSPRHGISSRSGETTSLPPVSKNTRADIGNCSTAFPIYPDRVGGRKSCLG